MIVFNNISLKRGQTELLENATATINPKQKVGLVGKNGCGKSSLFALLKKELTPEGGEVTYPSNWRVSWVNQETPALDIPAIDYVIQGDREYCRLQLELEQANECNDGHAIARIHGQLETLDAWTIQSRAASLLHGLGFNQEEIAQPVKSFSGGWRMRLNLAQALLCPSDLLLLDEPTNHLDIDTIAWLTNFLKSSKKTVLFITHDRYFLDNVATRIFELDQANLIEYQGNYQDYVRLKAEQDERDAAALHKKKQLYKQELAWMRTQPQARATKQQARINRFKDLKGEVHQTVNNDDLEINFETSRIGKKVVNFEHVDFAYEDGKQILSDFNLIMQNRDRIGIVGDNGVGKSTLLNLINGDLVPTAGVLDIGETVRIGYFSQQIKDMDESKRVINYLQEVADEVKTTVGTTSITELLEQFLFPRSTHGTQIAKLSGGEKKRLYLLKILIEKPNVLLLDEPTNDLDIATLTVLENFLNGFGGPVVTVSHDRYFLDKVANKILAFEEGGVREFFGNYTDYLDEKAFLQEQSALLEKEKEQASVKVEKVKEDKKRMSYFEKQEWATIEDEIADLEAKIEEIEAAMLENASDYGQLATLQRDLESANETLLEKYERYEYLSELEG